MQPWIEKNCTIEHEGRTFEYGGAVITPDYVIGYVGKRLFEDAAGWPKTRILTDWHGNEIGTILLTASWPTPRSFVSSRLYQANAWVNGVCYTGRTAGEGMIFKGKRRKSKA